MEGTRDKGHSNTCEEMKMRIEDTDERIKIKENDERIWIKKNLNFAINGLNEICIVYVLYIYGWKYIKKVKCHMD